MLRIFCVLFVTVTLLSCVSTVQQYRGKTVEQAHVSKKSYEIGITYRVTVGNTVLRREEYTGYYVLEAFRPTNDFVISGGLMSAAFTFQGSANDTFPIVAQNENSNPMFAIPGTRFMMGINSEGYWDNTVASSNAMTSPIGSGRQYSLSPATTRFEATKMFKPKRGTNYINHELLLIGFSNSGIHLLFREYTPDDMIRAAFSQEAVYQLDSTTILFKNYTLEIVRSDSSSLTYRVVAD